MGTALLAMCFCAVSLLLALFVSLSPISEKAKIRILYAGAVVSFIAVPLMDRYIAGLNNFPAEMRYRGVLVFVNAVCCFCFIMAFMIKYQAVKKKVDTLEQTVEQLEHERATAMVQSVNEDKLQKVEESLEWFAKRISVFTKEKQDAINACAIAFAERNQINDPKIPIAVNPLYSQACLMQDGSQAFFYIGKSRKDISAFLATVFASYFPTGESFVYKKMPGEKEASRRGLIER